eukprot:TRINITY_DN2881_c0_g1_i1.p1 TRINITY_DN2881_c0_g1~~TRINITY_DN2881_c0_g1_i1.p1  ORF type:complete len:498 (-),score=134.64 TRINITY_DN2881_c0_g1_i1:16-1509(-)
MSIQINPLANPKDVKMYCELCNQPAKMQCPYCRKTYYCCKEHQTLDWEGVHRVICDKIAVVRTDHLVLGTDHQRTEFEEKIAQQRKEIIEISKLQATKFLTDRQFKLAIPGALQTLKQSQKYYGDSLAVIPAYLLLGETYLGLNQFDEVQNFISLAEWNIINVKAQMEETRNMEHVQNMGVGKQNNEDALDSTFKDLLSKTMIKNGGNNEENPNYTTSQQHQNIDTDVLGFYNASLPSAVLDKALGKFSEAKTQNAQNVDLVSSVNSVQDALASEIALEDATDKNSHKRLNYKNLSELEDIVYLQAKILLLKGKFLLEVRKYDTALEALAHSIYYYSLEVGPNNVANCPPLFFIGFIFHTLDLKENAFIFFNQVILLQRSYFETFLPRLLGALETKSVPISIFDELGEVLLTEMEAILTRIHYLYVDRFGEESVHVGLIFYTLGLFYTAIEEFSLALSTFEKASNILTVTDNTALELQNIQHFVSRVGRLVELSSET